MLSMSADAEVAKPRAEVASPQDSDRMVPLPNTRSRTSPLPPLTPASNDIPYSQFQISGASSGIAFEKAPTFWTKGP